MRLRIRKKTKEKQKILPRAWRSSGRYWMAMGTLVAYGAGSDLLLAQNLPSEIASGPQSRGVADRLGDLQP